MNSVMEMGSKTNSSYGTYFKDNYEISGSPKDYNLEQIFRDPQDNIDRIVSLSKYYYNKVGIIMRVVNIVRDFGSTGYTIEYPTRNKKAKDVVKAFEDKVKLERLIKDMVFEIGLTGNCAGYHRSGKRIDIYPVTKIEVSPLIIDNNPVLIYVNDNLLEEMALSEDEEKLYEKLSKTYPEEVAKGIQNGDERIVLNDDNTFFVKTNSSRYEPYGVPFILTAFDELAHKTVLKEAERSTATAIIDKVLMMQVGDSDVKPKEKDINFYHRLLEGKKGSVRITVPYYVDLKWIEPETSIFGKSKFEQVDQDILNALGVSLTLIRGEGGGNYSEAFISVEGLTKIIDNIRCDIPDVVNRWFRDIIVSAGIEEKHAPEFKFHPIEIDKNARIELVQWLFEHAGLPFEALYEEHGMNYSLIKMKREDENKDKVEDTFSLRQQPFQGLNQGGAPEKGLTDRKSDKSQSNNDQPRPSK